MAARALPLSSVRNTHWVPGLLAAAAWSAWAMSGAVSRAWTNGTPRWSRISMVKSSGVSACAGPGVTGPPVVGERLRLGDVGVGFPASGVAVAERREHALSHGACSWRGLLA